MRTALIRVGALAVCAGAMASAGAGPAAHASVEVAAGALGATLAVDAAGDAVVSWTDGGDGRHTLLVARDGSLRYGGVMAGADVSRSTGAVRLPWQVAVRETPDGSFYALQAWQRLDDGPMELRFSRWRGEPTTLSLHVVCCKWGSVNLEGSASFHGRPIYGYRSTPQGSPLDPYGRNVYLDTLQSGRWQRMMGILTHRPTGFFTLWIRSNWVGSAYRGTIPGPNLGWTLAPDALAETMSPPAARTPRPAGR
jgi:hypothetical protein